MSFPVPGAAADWVELANEYLKVRVEKKSGRYILQTVKGDPNNSRDDNKFLSYNDEPPTSFTTIAFGEDGKKAYKYGSGDGKFLKAPVVENGTIVSIWAVNSCWVIQTLSFTNSPTTRSPDSLKIEYRVVNRSDAKKQVGVRILIDTTLGETDGTPYFLPGVGKVDNEREYSGSAIPTYWYSFDNLDNPVIRSMGTVKDAAVTLPDRLIFASWKKLDQHPWKYKVNSGSSFRRSLLGARDSAVAMYYNVREVVPGYEMKVSTLYGMFGTAVHQGKVWDLTLGGSSQAPSEETFTITLDVRNVSKLDLTNCTVSLALPAGILIPVPGRDGKYTKQETDGEDFDGGDNKRYTWYFKAREGIRGEYPYSVRVSGYHGTEQHQGSAQRTLLINEPVKNTAPLISMVDPGILDSSLKSPTNIPATNAPATNAFVRHDPAGTTNRAFDQYPLVYLTHQVPQQKVPGFIVVKSPPPLILVRIVTNAPLVLVTTNRVAMGGPVTNMLKTNASGPGTAATNAPATGTGAKKPDRTGTTGQDAGVKKKTPDDTRDRPLPRDNKGLEIEEQAVLKEIDLLDSRIKAYLYGMAPKGYTRQQFETDEARMIKLRQRLYIIRSSYSR